MEDVKMSLKQIFFSLTLFMLALALGACTSAKASQATKLDSQISAVTIKATDYNYEAPDQIEAGLVTINFVNEGQEAHHAQLVRLNDGVTLEQLQTTMQENEMAAMALVSFVGGPGAIDPGMSSQISVELTPGQYLLMCFITSHDGMAHVDKGMIRPMEVVAASQPASVSQPKAAGTVTLMDFSFVLPSEIKTGKQVWQVVNKGTQPHEILLVKLAEGKSMADVQAFVEHPHGTPPFTSMGGFQAVTPGVSGWLHLDLQPGDYVALCFVPDPASGHAHTELGMVMPFSVK
jgi:hypothetical protein